MPSNTTEKQLNITMGSDVRFSGEESWFVENFGLFMIMVVLSSSFIVFSAFGLWQVCSWAKCRRLQRKSGKYYVKVHVHDCKFLSCLTKLYDKHSKVQGYHIINFWPDCKSISVCRLTMSSCPFVRQRFG